MMGAVIPRDIAMPHIPEQFLAQTAKLPPHWMYALDSAQLETDIVGITRDYIASWTPAELARLPAACRPGRIIDGGDIADHAFRIARANLAFAGSLAETLLLDRMLAYFSHASMRVAHVLSRSEPIVRQ